MYDEPLAVLAASGTPLPTQAAWWLLVWARKPRTDSLFWHQQAYVKGATVWVPPKEAISWRDDPLAALVR